MLPFCLQEEAAPCAEGGGLERLKEAGAGSWVLQACQGLGHVQLPPSVLTLAPMEGIGKPNPGEEPAITGLSKRPPGKNGVVYHLRSLPVTHGPSPLSLCPHILPRSAGGSCFTDLAHP